VKRLVLTFAVLVLFAAGCSSGGGVGSATAATVNGTDISISSLYADLDVLANSSSYKSGLAQSGTEVYGSDGKTYTTAFASGWLSVLIQNTLVEQQLESLGGAPTADETSQAQSTYQQLSQSGEIPPEFVDRLVTANANQLALQRVIEDQAPPQPVTDADVRAYYDENIDATMQQVGGEVACVTHITAAFDPTGQSATSTPEQQVAAQQQIDQIAARVRAGEDFVTVADSFSAETAGAVSGGNLGCIPRGGDQVPAALDDAAYTLAVGQVSEPIQTEIGVHLIVVRSRGVLPFEEAADTIRQQLEENKGDVTQAAANEFLRSATITVDPRFGTFDAEQAAVIPPEGPASPSTTLPLVDQLQGGGAQEERPTAGSGTP
jgi:parvulin-like peptidyl-prolyl isomerase